MDTLFEDIAGFSRLVLQFCTICCEKGVAGVEVSSADGDAFTFASIFTLGFTFYNDVITLLMGGFFSGLHRYSVLLSWLCSSDTASSPQ